MCHEMDEIYNEGEKIGRAEGRAEGIAVGEINAKKEMVISLSKLGIATEQIAQAAKISVKIVREWIADGMVSVK